MYVSESMNQKMPWYKAQWLAHWHPDTCRNNLHVSKRPQLTYLAHPEYRYLCFYRLHLPLLYNHIIHNPPKQSQNLSEDNEVTPANLAHIAIVMISMLICCSKPPCALLNSMRSFFFSFLSSWRYLSPLVQCNATLTKPESHIQRKAPIQTLLPPTSTASTTNLTTNCGWVLKLWVFFTHLFHWIYLKWNHANLVLLKKYKHKMHLNTTQTLALSSFVALRIWLMIVKLSDYFSHSHSKVKQRGVFLLLSFVLMSTLTLTVPPPTPPKNTSGLCPSFCLLLIVSGGCSNSINSHSVWWLVPVHWWPGGCSVVCWHHGEVVLSCRMNRLRMWKAGSAVGHVWLYTLTAGDCWLLKLHTWVWKTSDMLQQ